MDIEEINTLQSASKHCWWCNAAPQLSTAVCTDGGHIWYTCFGRGGYGQQRYGDKERRASPALVQALEDKQIT